MQLPTLALFLTLRNPPHSNRGLTHTGAKVFSLLSRYHRLNHRVDFSSRSSSRQATSSSLHSTMTATTTSKSSSSLGDVIVVGSANQDLTSYTPSIPNIGETVLGSRFETSCGGKGANQAVAAAGLEIAKSVHMVCRVGDDSFGQALMSNFRKYGIVKFL